MQVDEKVTAQKFVNLHAKRVFLTTLARTLGGKIYVMATTVSSRQRTRKALRISNRIVLSYLFHFLTRRFRSQSKNSSRLNRLHERHAVRLKSDLLDLNGLFIKVGQLVSALSHILPDAYQREMEEMQDHTPSQPLEALRKHIEGELKQPISEAFSHVEEIPLASASIGQVFKGTLTNGTEVAIKIQHPGIEQLAHADLEILRKMVKRIAFFFRVQGIEHVYEQVRQMILEELDYRIEAKAMSEIRSNLRANQAVIIPVVVDEFTTERLLVTHFYKGVKITQIATLDKWEIDRNGLAKNLLETYLHMILEDGFYQADPHPGNLLVNQEGKLILLDFGAVASMNAAMRKEIPIVIQAIFSKDVQRIVKSLKTMGFIGNDKDSVQLAEKLIDAVSRFLQNEVQMNNLNFKDIGFDDIQGSSLNQLLREISIRDLVHTIRIPRDWILFDRTLQLLLGTTNAVAPELNPVEVIKPYLKHQFIMGGGLRKIVLDAMKKQLFSLLTLPGELHAFLRKANHDQLQAKAITRQPDVYALGQQFFAFACTLTFLLLWLLSIRPEFDVYFIISSSIGFLLFIRTTWKARRQS